MVHQLERGMAGGVAFVAAVPGLAPWGFYAGETAGEIAILFDPACAT